MQQNITGAFRARHKSSSHGSAGVLAGRVINKMGRNKSRPYLWSAPMARVYYLHDRRRRRRSHGSHVPTL